MSYESRAYDNEWGDPVVVLVVTGTHDVSRLVHLFLSGMALVEHLSVAETMAGQVRAHAGGRAALELLKAHGGPDLLRPQIEVTDLESAILRGYAAGLEDREIAEQCGITYSRVEKIAKPLRRILGARNRAHAAVLAMRAGLITEEANGRA